MHIYQKKTLQRIVLYINIHIYMHTRRIPTQIKYIGMQVWKGPPCIQVVHKSEQHWLPSCLFTS